MGVLEGDNGSAGGGTEILGFVSFGARAFGGDGESSVVKEDLQLFDVCSL